MLTSTQAFVHDGSLTLKEVLAEVTEKNTPPAGTTHFCYAFRKFYWVKIEEWEEPPPTLSILEENVKRSRGFTFSSESNQWLPVSSGFRNYPIDQLPEKLLQEAAYNFNDRHGIDN